MLGLLGSPESFPVFPLASATGSFVPTDLEYSAYSPALLLAVQFDDCIAADSRYQIACEAGFHAYFEQLEEENRNEVLIWDEVRNEVIANVFDANEVFAPGFSVTSLAWDTGFTLGWLSALALTDRPLALHGLGLLVVLVDQVQKVIS